MKTKLIYILPALLLGLFSCDNSGIENSKEIEIQTEVDSNVKLEEGEEIAKATFKVLSSNLKKSMEKGGLENALSFCNVNAMPLTDSLSQYYNVTIKRISDKARNPKNLPTENEQNIIDNFKVNAKNKNPIIEMNNNGNSTFYAPIITKALCLNCHGTVGESLLPENHEKIKLLYPNDKAINYNEGEQRGVWSIEFKK